MKVLVFLAALSLVFSAAFAQDFNLNIALTDASDNVLDNSAVDNSLDTFKFVITADGNSGDIGAGTESNVYVTNAMIPAAASNPLEYTGVVLTGDNTQQTLSLTIQSGLKDADSLAGQVLELRIPAGLVQIGGDSNVETVYTLTFTGTANDATVEGSTFDDIAADFDISLDQFYVSLSQQVDADLSGATFAIADNTGSATFTDITAISIDAQDPYTVIIDSSSLELLNNNDYTFTLSGLKTKNPAKVIPSFDFSETTVAAYTPNACGLEAPYTDFFKFGKDCVCEGPKKALESADDPNVLVLGADQTGVDAGVIRVVYDEPLYYNVKDYNTARIGLQPDIQFMKGDGTTSNADCMNAFTWTIVSSDDDNANYCDAYNADNTNAVPNRRWKGEANIQDFYNLCQFDTTDNADPPQGTASVEGVDWSYTTLNMQVTNYQTIRLEKSPPDEDGNTYTGAPLTREVTHLLAWRLYYQQSSAVEVATVSVFSNAAAVRAIVKQAVSSYQPADGVDGAEADFEVFFQVQYPFALTTAGATIAESGSTPRGFEFVDWSVDADADPEFHVCDQSGTDDSAKPCRQLFTFKMRTPESPELCNFDSTLIAEIPLVCVPEYDDECFLDGETVKVAFTIDSSNHCPQVADTVELQQEFKSYASYNDKTAAPVDTEEKTNFLAGQTAFYVAKVWSDQVGIKEAQLINTVISGSTILETNNEWELIDSSGAATNADTTVLNVGADTTGGNAGDALYPWLSLKVNPDDSGSPFFLNVDRRSSAVFTVSGTVAVTYQTTFTQAGVSKEIPFSTSGSLETLGFKSVNSPVSAQATIGGTDADASEETASEESGDLLQNQSAITAGIGAVGLVAMAVAFFAMKRGQRAQVAKIESSSSNSNLMLQQMTSTASDNSRDNSIEGDASV